MEALDQFIASMLTLERWPFWSAALIFTLIGHFMSESVFTRPRAYMKDKHQWFWWWGRESQVLHPISAGVVLGLLWPDPEGRHWPQVASCAYFAVAGALSLVLWVIIQGVARKKGITLTLPGDSDKPPAS
jgi:hypothetical protein